MGSALEDSRLTLSVLEDFGDPLLERARWDCLLGSSTDVVFLRHAWQREWWRAFGGDRLMIVLAARGDQVVALAPLFAVEEMLFIVGSGGSDYLDFIGTPDQETLAAMLDLARSLLPDFAGIGLYHVPLQSPTATLLPDVAARLGLDLHREGELSAPYADLNDREAVTRLVTRRSVRKEEARMRRAGPLCVRSAASDQLEEWLELFFAQHAARWRPSGEEGLEDGRTRAFCRSIVHQGHHEGWLRFTMLEWRGAPAAFDISLLHGDTQLSYLVSRDPSIHDHSPGRVLQAQVIARAAAAGMHRLDFGLGEEEYKRRVATGSTRLANWFLYPP
jgi:CelD/BcsL family acetyltransferase involved in cellulose biosynthesis